MRLLSFCPTRPASVDMHNVAKKDIISSNLFDDETTNLISSDQVVYLDLVIELPAELTREGGMHLW